MDNREMTEKSIQDEHLDMLIRLAYRRKNEKLLNQCVEEKQEDARLDPARKAATYAKFLEKYEALEKERSRRERMAKWKRRAPRLINAVACLALIFCIAAPIAVAKVEYIRVRVMKLLIDIQADHTRLSFVEDEDAAFYVPEGWTGEYYPSYIPEGFVVTELGETKQYVTLNDASGGYIHFIERDDKHNVGMDTESANVLHVSVNGEEAIVVEKDDRNVVIWSAEDTYFLVATTLSADECVKIASGVRKIEK